MRCQSCGKEIDDKAIVCYRCGEPTAIPASARPADARPRSLPSGRPRWGIVPIIAVIVALGAWIVPMTPADSWQRSAAFAGVAVLTFVALRLYTGRGLTRRRHRVD